MTERLNAPSPEIQLSFVGFMGGNQFYKDRVLQLHPEKLHAVLEMPYDNLARSYFAQIPGKENAFSFSRSLEYFPHANSFILKQRSEHGDPNECGFRGDDIVWFSEQKRDVLQDPETIISHNIEASWSRENELLYVNYASDRGNDPKDWSHIQYKVYYDKPRPERELNTDQLEIAAVLDGPLFRLTSISSVGTDEIAIPVEIFTTHELREKVVHPELEADFKTAPEESNTWKNLIPSKLLGISWKHAISPTHLSSPQNLPLE